MVKSLYGLWSEEVFRKGTISLAYGTAEPTYDVDRLVDDNPARLFKATGTTVVMDIAFAAKQPLAVLHLIHTTLETTDDVWVQGDDGEDWYAPSFEAQITPAGWVGSGETRWPLNTYLNLTEAEGYDPAGFLFYRLTFGVAAPLAQALQMGQLVGSPTLRFFELDRNFQEVRKKPRIENRTAYEIATIYPRGTTIWRGQLSFSALLDSESERAALQTLWDDVDGGNKPWPLVPDESEPECYLVRFATDEEQITRVVKGVSTRAGLVEELGRGLRPGV